MMEKLAWLVTRNDNLHALDFYQKSGFHFDKVDRGAVDQSQAVKPSIFWSGKHCKPIHNEIELEFLLK